MAPLTTGAWLFEEAGALAGGATPEDCAPPEVGPLPVVPLGWVEVMEEPAGVEEWPGKAWLT